MKVYISGPMRGVKHFNFPAFSEAAMRLRSIGYEVVSPHEEDLSEGMGSAIYSNESGDVGDLLDKTGRTSGQILARDVQLLIDGKFNGIVLLPGWEKSFGARLELFLSLLMGLQLFAYMSNGPAPLAKLNVLGALWRSLLGD